MNTLPNKWYEYFLFKGGGIKLLFMLGCLGISTFLGYYGPILLMELGRALGDKENFYGALLSLGFLYGGVCINRITYQILALSYVTRLIENIRSHCYNNWLLNNDIQTDSKSTSDRYPLGEVMARIMTDTDTFRELITSGTLTIIVDICFVVSCFISFLSLDAFAGKYLLGAELLACALLFWASKRMRGTFMRVREARGNISRVVANIVGGIRETYYTNNSRYASQKGEVVFHNFLRTMTISNIWDAGHYSLAESLYPMLILLVAVIFPHSGVAETALMFAIIDLIQRSIEPIKSMASKMTNIQRSLTGWERVNNFLGDLEYIDKRDKRGQLWEFDEIRVRIEEFSYPNANFCLKDIDFTALKGQMVGIVGMSGSGKSTLLNMMAANIISDKVSIELISHCDYPPLRFSGNSLDELSSYRQQIGVISQDAHIFSESVLFNISFERDSCDEFEDFWDWVTEKIPYLCHWGIEPGDVLNPQNLSLGQTQLLAALRACYLKRPVVLFDEISSALDSDLEEALREVILLVQKRSMTIVVAHRVETVMAADRILLLEKGTLASLGTHRDLLTRSPKYRNFISELSH